MSKLAIFGLVVVGGAAIGTVAGLGYRAQRRKREMFCRRTSTRQHRLELARRGIDLNGKDVCHVIAGKNGGPAHRHNYFPCPSGLNRSLGHRHDDVMCALAGVEKCAQARRVTRICMV